MKFKNLKPGDMFKLARKSAKNKLVKLSSSASNYDVNAVSESGNLHWIWETTEVTKIGRLEDFKGEKDE